MRTFAYIFVVSLIGHWATMPTTDIPYWVVCSLVVAFFGTLAATGITETIKELKEDKQFKIKDYGYSI